MAIFMQMSEFDGNVSAASYWEKPINHMAKPQICKFRLTHNKYLKKSPKISQRIPDVSCVLFIDEINRGKAERALNSENPNQSDKTEPEESQK